MVWDRCEVAELCLSAAPEKPATPLIPAASVPVGEVRSGILPAIDGGALWPIDAAPPPAVARPDDPPPEATRSRRQPGRAGRAAHAVSAFFNLFVLCGLTASALGIGSLPPSAVNLDLAATRAPAPDVTAAAAPAPASRPADQPAPAALPPAEPQDAAAAVPPQPPPTPSAPAMPQAVASAPPQPPPVTPPAPAPAAEPVALPAPPASEAEHVARFDAFIAPVRDAQMSVEDATRLRDAMAALSNPTQARGLRDQIADPAARKLIDWALARGGNGSARDIKTFADRNAGWPSQDLLAQRAEEQLFVGGGSVRDIKSFFDKGTPKTGIGMAALASAFLAEGDEAQARQLASAAWRRSDIPASLETGFLERFAKLLTEDDHKARFDRYMIDNTRWNNDRADRAAVARRVLPHLGEAERKKADARLAAYLRQANADALMAALPADAMTAPKPDWGLAFQMSQWNRRAGRLEVAWKILRDAPTDAAVAVNLDEWWEERRLAAYDALKAGKPKIAYDLVKSAGRLSANPAKDQAFVAGWIALRHLDDPKSAEQHFTTLEKVADGPLSRARAGYWLARALEAQKSPDRMRAPLERAARNFDTFYGQLARLELDPKRTDIKIALPKSPTPDEVKRFNDSELVRAAVDSRKANLEISVTRMLLARLSQTLDTEAEHALLAHLAEALGDPQMAVRIGKAAIARGFNMTLYAYPLKAMPAYQALRTPPEQALVLGIARQESEFDTNIVSGAGARGLMQVMTVTAQHVCRDYKIKCELERLSTDPAYNAMMATAYIADRMDEFQGSYVLAIAGYNAGPNRVRQWIKDFGDPRTPAVDPVDWINRIPFEETREYVQKVLSNTQIYRARLGHEADALRLTADLRRTAATPERRSAVAPQDGAGTARN